MMFWFMLECCSLTSQLGITMGYENSRLMTRKSLGVLIIGCRSQSRQRRKQNEPAPINSYYLANIGYFP